MGTCIVVTTNKSHACPFTYAKLYSLCNKKDNPLSTIVTTFLQSHLIYTPATSIPIPYACHNAPDAYGINNYIRKRSYSLSFVLCPSLTARNNCPSVSFPP